MAQGPYSRIYWCFVEEFPVVYHDDRALATFTRLLLLADGTYPAAAPMPRWVKPAPLRALVDAGLVILLPGDYYRIKGQAAERTRRQQRAKAAAEKRWGGGESTPADAEAYTGGDATSNAQSMPVAMLQALPPALQTSDARAPDENMPSRAEQSKAEQSKAVCGADAPPARAKPLSYRPRIDVAWPGRPPVPGTLHAEFRDKLGGDPDEADARLRAWYPEAAAPYADQPIGDDDFRFWRARFAEWVGTTVRAVPRVTPADTAGYGTTCPHDPPCRRTTECVARIIDEARQERQAQEAATA